MTKQQRFALRAHDLEALNIELVFTTDNTAETARSARLIAAAPELLEALQAAVKYHGNQEGFCPEWLVQAWKAIAKATGEMK